MSPFDESQAMAALDTATERRIAAARFKKTISSPADIAEALEVARVPAWLEHVKLYALLMAIPRWGRWKSLQFLVSVHLHEGTRVRDLGLQARARVAAALRDRD